MGRDEAAGYIEEMKSMQKHESVTKSEDKAKIDDSIIIMDYWCWRRNW